MADSPPPLPQTEPDWPSFQVWWQQVIENLQEQLTTITASVDALQKVTDTLIHSTSHPTAAVLSGAANGATAKITISAHVRRYPLPDGTLRSVTVNAGEVTGLLYGKTYYVFYDDPTFNGGTVTYQALETAADATQRGARHTVGAATTPATSSDPPVEGSQSRGAGVGTLNLSIDQV